MWTRTHFSVVLFVTTYSKVGYAATRSGPLQYYSSLLDKVDRYKCFFLNIENVWKFFDLFVYPIFFNVHLLKSPNLQML